MNLNDCYTLNGRYIFSPQSLSRHRCQRAFPDVMGGENRPAGAVRA